MKQFIRNYTLASLAGALALIGSLHAPLYAEEADTGIDEIRAEIVTASAELDQREVLKNAAENALDGAQRRLNAHIVIELDSGLTPRATQVVASNEM